jgi:hypothetical protein
VYGPRPKPDRFWRWLAAGALAVVAIPVVLAIFGLLAAIAIPNFVKARARAQEHARLASTAPAARIAPASTLPWRVITNVPFAAGFPTGSVEILAIATASSHHPDTNWMQTWWRPDGLPTDALPYDMNGSGSIGPGDTHSVFHEIVMQSKALPAGASGLVVDDCDPGTGSVWSYDRNRADVLLGYLKSPVGAKTLHLKIGVAAGPWKRTEDLAVPQTDLSSYISFDEEEIHWTVCVQSIEEIRGSTKVIAHHTVAKGWQAELVLVDMSGKEWLPGLKASTMDGLCHLNGKCEGLKLSEVKTVQFRVRPYQFAEFRNVSLQGGLRTQVEVNDAGKTTGFSPKSEY